MKTIPLYLQLYSLRRETAEDAPGTLRRVRGLGFAGVELAGDYGWSAEQWREMLDETGLTALSAHVGLETLETALEPQLIFHRALGTNRLVVSSLPAAPQSPARYHDGARRLNALGERLRVEGFRLGYHNHAEEFAALPGGGPCGMDHLLAETDPALMGFEPDVAWIESAGCDAVAYLRQHADRVELLHARDLRASDGQDVPLGRGDVDFPALALLRAAGDWPVIIEYTGDDALESVRRGAAFLRGLL